MSKEGSSSCQSCKTGVQERSTKTFVIISFSLRRREEKEKHIMIECALIMQTRSLRK